MWIRIKTHWIALTVALFLGVATVLPQMIAVSRLGADFSGVYPTNNDDELYYLARAQEVRDGHPTLGNPYLFEYKEQPPMAFWLPDTLLSSFGGSIGVTPHKMFLISDLVFPAILALLSYAILFLLTRSIPLALTGMILIHLGTYFREFNRPISPQFTLIFFEAFLLSLLRWNISRTWKPLLLATVCFGVVFNSYTYYWTYIVVFLGLLGTGYVLIRDFQGMRGTLAILLGGGVFGIPYILQLLESRALPEYGESLARLGMIATHVPSGVLIVALSAIFVVALFFMLWKRYVVFDRTLLLITAGVLATTVVVNQHLVTGMNLEFSSHYRQIAILMFVFGLAYLFARLLERFTARTYRIVALMLLGVVVGWSFVSASQIIVTQSVMRSDEIAWQRYGGVFTWLNEHTRMDDVVYANDTLSTLIPAYTHNNVLYAREANLHLMPDADVHARYVASRYFSPLNRDMVIAEEHAVFGTYRINYSAHLASENILRKVVGIVPRGFSRYDEDAITDVLALHADATKTPFAEVIAPHRVDYVIWDSVLDPTWDARRIDGLEEVYSINGIVIFARDYADTHHYTINK